MYCHYNNRFSFDCIWLNLRDNLRLAGVGNCIGNAVHRLKKYGFIYSNYLSGLVHYAENKFSALRIGIGHNRLCILFCVLRRHFLEFCFFGFSPYDLFNRHTATSLLNLCQNILK